MSTVQRIGKASFLVLSWTGLGVLLWSLMAPSNDRLQEMRRQEEKINPARMAELRQQNELIIKALKEAAETSKNVTYKGSSR